MKAQPPGQPDTVPASYSESFLSFIERAARDPNFDVQKFATLLEERAKIERQRQQAAYFHALAGAQSEMNQVARDRGNDYTKSRYATLDALDGVSRPVYTKYGLALSFSTLPPTQPNHVRVVLTISHHEGHFEAIELEGPISSRGAQGGQMAMTPIQAVGATITYLRRYLLMMVLNLVQADDPLDNDGNDRVANTKLPGNGAQQPQEDLVPKPAASMSEKELLRDFGSRLAFPPDQEKAKSLAVWRGDFTVAQRKLVDRLLKEIRDIIAADNQPHYEMDREAMDAADRDRDIPDHNGDEVPE
jgi:hypothetical protein